MLFFQIFNESIFVLTCIAVIASVVAQFVSAMRKRRSHREREKTS